MNNNKYYIGSYTFYIGDSDHQSFIGKPTSGVEKDNESSLGDCPTRWFGVRKYDDFTGRFFQIDPLYEKYYSWMPYQYCMNNPVSLLDPSGRFAIEWHARAYEEAKIMGFTSGMYDGLYRDVGQMDVTAIHFDNLVDYESVRANVDALGGFEKMPLHSLGDFFAHSNYVDIWVGLGYEGAPPLPTEVVEGSEFDSALRDNLRTTNYHGLFGDENEDPYGHNDGYSANPRDIPEGNPKRFGSKDKIYEGEARRTILFLMAYRLYVRALKAYHVETVNDMDGNNNSNTSE